MASVVLLLDDPALAAAMRSALEAQHYRVLAELHDASALHTEVVRLAPDVVIVGAGNPLLKALDEIEALKKELATARTRLAERKLIEKAKGIVMQQRGASEDEAYASLRRMAMNQNLPLAEVARRVITVAQLIA